VSHIGDIFSTSVPTNGSNPHSPRRDW
jgi:hypothetical protein